MQHNVLIRYKITCENNIDNFQDTVVYLLFLLTKITKCYVVVI